MDDYLLSVVIPVYNEGKQVNITVNTIHEILAGKQIPYEMILVDDGSADNSWEEIVSMSQKYDTVVGIKLSRNFGKESAICAGLENVKGDAAVLLDADLQHPPENIPEMVRLWRDDDYDIIEGVKTTRGKERVVTKVGSKLFYKLLNKAAGFDLDKASDFKLMDRQVIEAWKAMPERNTFFRAMSHWVGYKRYSLPIEIADREIGQSKWSISSLVRLAVTAVSSFSALPLFVVTFLGIIFFIGAVALAAQTLYMKFQGGAYSGFTTVILLQLIIGSILMISLGIIGLYIAKIFDEVKGRPRYLIKQITGRKKDK